jgi:hypothetical protein
MYLNNVVLLIEEISTNLSIPIPSLRTDTTGVTFTNIQQPTLLVELNYTLISYIISISIPSNNGVTNVNQIELAFYGTDGQILRNSIGEPWIVETSPDVTIVGFIFYTTEKKLYLFSLNNSYLKYQSDHLRFK